MPNDIFFNTTSSDSIDFSYATEYAKPKKDNNCAVCSKKIKNEPRQYWGEKNKWESICNDCLKITPKCPSCNYAKHQKFIIDGYCLDCIKLASENHIQHYHTKAEQTHKKIVGVDSAKFISELAKERYGKLYEEYYGIELEYRAHPIEKLGLGVLKAKKSVERFAIIKYDSTLDNEIVDEEGCKKKQRAGFEVVSAPADIESQYKDEIWTQFFDSGLDKHMIPDEKCGCHIHRSKEDLSELVLAKVVAFVHDVNNRNFMEMIAGRPAGKYFDWTYDKSILDVLNIPNSVKNKEKSNISFERPNITLKDYSGKSKVEDNNHRTAINFNTSNKQTIEFRIFRGCGDRSELLKNVEFVKAICEFCKHCSLKHIKGYNHFIQYVVNNRNHYRYLYKFFLGSEFGGFINKYDSNLTNTLMPRRVRGLNNEYGLNTPKNLVNKKLLRKERLAARLLKLTVKPSVKPKKSTKTKVKFNTNW